MGDLNKLPRWAQDEIRSRDNKIEDLTRRLEVYETPAGPLTVVTGLESYDTKVALPFHRYRFKTKHGDFEVTVQQDGELVIRTLIDWISILPQAANSIAIRTMR